MMRKIGRWIYEHAGWLAALLVLAAILVFLAGRASATPTDSIARSIVATCENGGTNRAVCYEATVPALYPKWSVAQIFDVVRKIRTLDTSYQFCHVLGHKIGERVVAEDPEHWLGAIPLNPSDGLCSNGFIHGVVGGRFRSEVLSDATAQQFLPDFIKACAPHDAWNPSRLDRAICYHGMGHLFMFITNAQVTKALDLCERVAPDEYRRVCIQGVFMQIYQPLEPDDYALIEQMPVKPTKTTVRQYCASFTQPMYEGSCLEESWPLFRNEILQGNVATFCSGQPDATETDMCYVSMSSIVGRMSLGSVSAVTAACNGFPDARQKTCFSYSAEAVLEESLNDASSAVAVCERAPSGIAEACIQGLISHANFTFGSNKGAYNHFCASVPTAYQSACYETQSRQYPQQ